METINMNSLNYFVLIKALDLLNLKQSSHLICFVFMAERQ